MNNFFNAIGVADMEKVHSAIIAWILDDRNDQMLHSTSSANSQFTTFSLPIRSEFLCELFQVKPIKQFKSIQTQIEWNDIDVMIETTDCNGNKEIWVIENKLKSQEHLSREKNGTLIWQTCKYKGIVDQTFPLQQKHYLLLSLGGDKAKYSSGLWLPSTYTNLCTIIQKNLTNSHNSFSIIEEYAKAIDLLVSELNAFLQSGNPGTDYPHVFSKLTNARKATILFTKQKGGITVQERYIIENGLETIFQKQLLAQTIANCLPQLMNNVTYDERNGTAMFIYHVDYISDFELTIEFQGGAYKVSLLHKDYAINNSNENTNRLYGKWNGKTGTGHVFQTFQKLAKKNGWIIAIAKNLVKGTAKPRIALVKNIGNNWYHNPNNAFVTVYHDAEKIAQCVKKQIPSIP